MGEEMMTQREDTAAGVIAETPRTTISSFPIEEP